MRSLLRAAFAAVLLLAAVAPSAIQAQAGPPGGMIYANDQSYRTVGTPADLPEHGEFNAIYPLGSGLAAVSDAAPGDRNWRGGRWEVRPVTFLSIPPTQFTNAAALRAAAQRGEISIGDVVRRFECPLIPVRER